MQLNKYTHTPPELIDMRSEGALIVRFEFITRLLHLSIQIATLSIYWEDGKNFFQIPIVENASRKLVFAGTPRVSGKFDDMSLLCYSSDAETKVIVDTEIDRMVAVIRDYWLKQSRTIT